MTADPRLPVPYAEDALLVGINKRKEKILAHIMQESVQQLKVISIFGIGGLGKSTLAKAAYHSQEMMSDMFDCRAFITLSQTLPMKGIVEAILDEFRMEATLNMLRIYPPTINPDVLAEVLRSQLDGKRYLIVVDDVSSESAWDSLMTILPQTNPGSVVIATTRDRAVSRCCCNLQHGYSYEVEALDEIEARELFFIRAFGSVQECPQNLEEVSEAIMKKCGGVPLAINCMARLLAGRSVKSLDEWQSINQSFGPEFEISSPMEKLKHILLLSYEDLPSHLKICLLCLSIYPEKHKIATIDIIRRWVAEGLVPDGTQEVAESYFSELVNRCMIQPLIIGLDGKVETCMIHDLVLDLMVSLSKEQNFVSFLGSQHPAISDGNVRRLAIHCDEGAEDILSSMDLSNVLSVSYFGAPGQNILAFDKAQLLTVLHLEGGELLENEHIEVICSLLQLKLLNLRNISWAITLIPTEIGKLQKLESIDIGCREIELPSSFLELERLVHLFAEGIGEGHCMLPRGFGKMKSIQTLPTIHIGDNTSWMIEELGLMYLKKLKICIRDLGIEDSRSLCSMVEKLSRRSLQSLAIEARTYDDCPLTLDFSSGPALLLKSIQIRAALDVLPSWWSLLGNIVGLHLGWCDLKEDALQILQDLPSLIYLILGPWSMHQSHLSAKRCGFPSLEQLSISCDQENDGLRVTIEEGAMQKLRHLKVLTQSARLESLDGVRYLNSLQQFEFRKERDRFREPISAEEHLVLDAVRAEASGLPDRPAVVVIDDLID